MKVWVIACASVVVLLTAGCQKKAEPSAGVDDGWHPFGPPHGRFLGLGIYSPGDAWAKRVDAGETKDERAAKPLDDQAIFVVIDSATGEVRACGDMTGYCIGMNPWRSALVAVQVAPLRLSEHVKPDGPNMTIEVEPKASKPQNKTDPPKDPPTPDSAN